MRQVLKIVLCAVAVMAATGPPHPARAAEATGDPAGYLEALGYSVVNIGEGTSTEGKPYAFVNMEWESKDFWSADTTTQVVSAFYALSSGYPDASMLLVDLAYSGQYDVIWRVLTEDWNKYVKDKDWEAFKQTESFFVGLWDNDAGAYVNGSTLTRFINKNFGGGVWAEPKFPGPVTGGAYGAVTISPASGQAKAKGEVVLSIAVLDKQQEPVADADVEVIVMGTAAGSRVAPKATSTDDAGKTRVTFTAGSKDGVAVIVAKSRGTFGAATVKVGKGDTDPAASGVIAALAQKGYKIYDAGVSADDPDTSTVDMDMVGILLNADGSYDPQTLLQIVDGWTALSDGYPKAKLLTVITRYQSKYGIHWTVTPKDLTAYIGKTVSADDFWASQFDGIVVYDLTTGKEVSTKDFADKNFGSD